MPCFYKKVYTKDACILIGSHLCSSREKTKLTSSSKTFHSLLYKTNRFRVTVAVYLFHNRDFKIVDNGRLGRLPETMDEYGRKARKILT